MQIGIFAAIMPDPTTGVLLSSPERMAGLLNEVDLADRVGLDVFELGEEHHIEFLDSGEVQILRRKRQFLPNLWVGSVCHRLARESLQVSVPVRLMSKSIDEPVDEHSYLRRQLTGTWIYRPKRLG